jgi:biopolymer transport protein TolR
VPKVHQSGGGGGGRGRRGARVSTSLAEINVVPLIDVMLVLLIIFMVTAPMMQQGLEVNLPQARRANPVTSQPVYVTVPRDFSSTRTVQLGTDMVSLDALGERVHQMLLTRDDKSVYVRPDAAANIQDFFDVTDVLKAAGVDKVALMSKPRETR